MPFHSRLRPLPGKSQVIAGRVLEILIDAQSLHAVFNYILQVLYLGCQWKKLPIEKDQQGRPEIHYTRVYSALRKWQADGCLDAIFRGSVGALHENHHLDISVIHGDGTTTAAKKGGDNIGFRGHKKVKGDKIVAFCDRNCNVIAPFLRPRVIVMNPLCCERPCHR